MRTILHSDLNNFFASVELKRHPELRDKPMAVGGDEQMRHGIILAKNEIAKSFGINTAETLWQARAKCPGLVIVPPHFDDYAAASKAVRELYYQFTDLIEPFGIDEAWLDVTASLKLWKDGREIADLLRERCKKELGLTLSIGVSFNKVFAKLGSDMKKPDAVTVISQKNFRLMIWPLPVSNLLYVGKATNAALRQRGIVTIGDLAIREPQYLASFLGKQGYMLHSFANGNDNSPVARYHHKNEAKSIGNGATLPVDIYNTEEAKPLLAMLADSVASHCRKSGVLASAVSVSLKDSSFNCCSMQMQLSKPSAVSTQLYAAALGLLEKNYNWDVPLRSITLTALTPIDQKSPIQLTLFDDEKQLSAVLAAEETMDSIRARFGSESIKKAITLTNNGQQKLKIDPHNSMKD